jgi:Tfp pilus assembly protein PilV
VNHRTASEFRLPKTRTVLRMIDLRDTILRMKTTLLANSRMIAVVVFVTALLSPLVCLAQSPETDPAKLNQQIEQLRRENQLLRSLLTQAQAPAANPAQPTSATAQATSTVAPAGQQQELTHWLTSSSNKRHNSSCRWFKTSKGRPCRADEGIPCKICGG